MLANLLSHLGRQGDLVFDLQSALTAARAVGPDNGGQGEAAKAALIEDFLRAHDITDIVHIDAPDARVPGGLRPNFIATLPGKSPRALWLFAHMDVVPSGDPALWTSDPWTVVRKGDLVYGRGVEDNQQALVSMLLLAKGRQDLHIVPEYTLKLVFMSDEECDNTMGLAHVLEKRGDLFPADDLYIIPDGGSPDGSEIEIAEKSLCWLRFTVTGEQCHASLPHRGVNALVAASAIIMDLQNLAQDFPASNPLFAPAVSTFTPTRHENNVDGVNIMPGRDVFWMDCRVLPETDLDSVCSRIRERASACAARYGATVSVDMPVTHRSSKTDADAPVVRALTQALAEAGITPRPVGIGGATVAALLRHRGLAACVWSTILSCCHEPNEHSSITATMKDAQVFARIVLGSTSF